MTEFRMPSLGADMDYGTVLEWRIRPGDRVRRGDVVVLVDTDKAEIEVETWESGVVEQILVAPGQKVPVGTVLATLKPEGEASAAPERPAPASREIPARREPARTRATPLARRIAGELGVEVAGLKGTGPEGAVTADDVRRAARAPGPAPAEPEPEERAARLEVPRAALSPERLAAMRRRIAAGMERSKREIPHYYLQTEIDLSRSDIGQIDESVVEVILRDQVVKRSSDQRRERFEPAEVTTVATP